MQRCDTAPTVKEAESSVRVVSAAWLMGILLLSACVSPSRTDLPNVGPFTPLHALPLGSAVGDVTSVAAVVWTRTEGPARVQVEWEAEAEGTLKEPSRSEVMMTSTQRDYTVAVPLEGLAPATSYRYRIFSQPQEAQASWEPRATGRFRTASSSDQSESVRFVWSGDIGGQEFCRQAGDGYAIFDRVRQVEPAFAILLGDLIYADHRCPSPPNAPGSEFIASTLDEFRSKHRYQREDAAFQRFLAEVPVHAIWDDHEVRDNFSGPSEALMPIGRQALLEYWPIRTDAQDPFRLYRRIHRGADLDVFILDTRQYRSRNGEPDGPRKTMLGVAQRDWLIDGLLTSKATWKVIATSVPLSLLKPGVKVPGNDSWAHAEDGTGFRTELKLILDAARRGGVRNMVWLAADVHLAQVNEYDPEGAGRAEFYEFVAGPLSAKPGKLSQPEPSLRPHILYADAGFMNFGVVTVTGRTLQMEIVDQTGATRFAHSITAK